MPARDHRDRVALQTLKAGGADVVLCASNPLSTLDDVAASLVKHDKIPTFAIKGEDGKTYYKHIMSVLDIKPQMTMDDGADVVSVLHTKRKDLLAHVIGGTEETTTGVIRLIGASDRLAHGQSTFMVEMSETANILRSMTERSLVVLDEIGRGTSTFDGLSIAWAVAEHLATNTRARPKALFATHYHELTELADTLPGVV